jgi:hypothetical protein
VEILVDFAAEVFVAAVLEEVGRFKINWKSKYSIKRHS